MDIVTLGVALNGAKELIGNTTNIIIQKISENDFSTLVSKDDNTLYVVVGDISANLYIGDLPIT